MARRRNVFAQRGGNFGIISDMEATEIIKAFCDRIGIAYEPDRYGSCFFEADGLRVAINDFREIDSIAIVGDLGEPPPQRLERLYRMMLEANHLLGATNGATLSLDSETGHFALCQFLPYRAVDVDSLYAVTDRFVSTLEAWTRVIGDFREIIPAAEKAEAGAGGGLAAPGFMQV